MQLLTRSHCPLKARLKRSRLRLGAHLGLCVFLWNVFLVILHPCAKLTHKIAAAAAAAAAAAKISARRRHGKKNIKIFTKTWKTKKLQKTSKKSINIDKNIDFGGARNKRTSPSNSTRKTTYNIDLFSCLYDRKWSKTLPVHVSKRSYVLYATV